MFGLVGTGDIRNGHEQGPDGLGRETHWRDTTHEQHPFFRKAGKRWLAESRRWERLLTRINLEQLQILIFIQTESARRAGGSTVAPRRQRWRALLCLVRLSKLRTWTQPDPNHLRRPERTFRLLNPGPSPAFMSANGQRSSDLPPSRSRTRSGPSTFHITRLFSFLSHYLSAFPNFVTLLLRLEESHRELDFRGQASRCVPCHLRPGRLKVGLVMSRLHVKHPPEQAQGR